MGIKIEKKYQKKRKSCKSVHRFIALFKFEKNFSKICEKALDKEARLVYNKIKVSIC